MFSTNSPFLQATNSSINEEQIVKANIETNAIIDFPPQCVVHANGKINCSDRIYHDRKVWKKSRNQIDSAIQTLKQRLEHLKEIRRHLKHTKPTPTDDKQIKPIDDSGETSNVDFDPLPTAADLFSLATTSTYDNITEEEYPESNRTARRRGNNKRRRFRLDANDTAVEFENVTTANVFDAIDLTTESPRTEITSHRPIR